MANGTIKVGLIGFGTVGAGVYRLLTEKNAKLSERIGTGLEVKRVCVKNGSKKRPVDIPKELLSTDFREIISDPEIDIVVEAIGGTTDAKKIFDGAIANGKHIVTANKALLAEQGYGIFRKAKEKNVLIGFEASVCAAVPIIKVLRESLVANDIQFVHTIVNGTCNYILTRMSEDGMDFAQALKLAQEKGFAEADPKLDIDGSDSAHKLVLLALTAFGAHITEKDILKEGITQITERDIEYAKELGYTIKLLAILHNNAGKLEARVHPTLLPKDHMLADIRNEFNAIQVKGDACGSLLFSGKGAGMMPTASAMVSDIVEIAKKIARHAVRSESIKFDSMKLEGLDEMETRHYLRFTVVDVPGVMAKISKTLGDSGISIASIIQKERYGEGEVVPVVLTTHAASEKKIGEALRQIDRLDCIKAKTFRIRMIES
ncbi:MAG: homoserine dehydrogenase [Candidatus Diapherotrites archaeon]|nr:homoserine dehydrogenase [Candidatus Diapherotrites archaeon]